MLRRARCRAGPGFGSGAAPRAELAAHSTRLCLLRGRQRVELVVAQVEVAACGGRSGRHQRGGVDAVLNGRASAAGQGAHERRAIGG